MLIISQSGNCGTIWHTSIPTFLFLFPTSVHFQRRQQTRYVEDSWSISFQQFSSTTSNDEAIWKCQRFFIAKHIKNCGKHSQFLHPNDYITGWFKFLPKSDKSNATQYTPRDLQQINRNQQPVTYTYSQTTQMPITSQWENTRHIPHYRIYWQMFQLPKFVDLEAQQTTRCVMHHRQTSYDLTRHSPTNAIWCENTYAYC